MASVSENLKNTVSFFSCVPSLWAYYCLITSHMLEERRTGQTETLEKSHGRTFQWDLGVSAKFDALITFMWCGEVCAGLTSFLMDADAVTAMTVCRGVFLLSYVFELTGLLLVWAKKSSYVATPCSKRKAASPPSHKLTKEISPSHFKVYVWLPLILDAGSTAVPHDIASSF